MSRFGGFTAKFAMASIVGHLLSCIVGISRDALAEKILLALSVGCHEILFLYDVLQLLCYQFYFVFLSIFLNCASFLNFQMVSVGVEIIYFCNIARFDCLAYVSLLHLLQIYFDVVVVF